MIQLQALNSILDKNNLDSYILAGITKEYFSNYEEEFNFIYNHHRQYNKVPDLATFLSRFRDFEVTEVLESTKFLVYRLKEEYLFVKGREVFQDCAKILEDNAFEGLNAIISKSNELLEQQNIQYGVNMAEMADVVLADIKRKKELNQNGIIGIKSGFESLDDYTFGWFPGNELVTIVGRVNQGKSWILQKFLIEANKQGKRVLHYSGEMTAHEVTYRNITLKYGISNKVLTTGDISEAQQLELNNLLQQEATLYQIVTPQDLGSNPLNVSTLKSLIKKYKPDIVGIDQISLMEDERRVKGDNRRIEYGHIAQDLFNLSSEFEIPILLAAQANRNKGVNNELENPALSDIAEADGIAQNSSRVISLVTKNNQMKLKLIKNRHGKVGWEKTFNVDLDKGEFNSTSDYSVKNVRRKNKNKNNEDVF